jgi:hypothetical protein
MARLPSGAVRASLPATERRGKERRRVGGSSRRRSARLGPGLMVAKPGDATRRNVPRGGGGAEGRLVLQADPEELPHPRRH